MNGDREGKCPLCNYCCCQCCPCACLARRRKEKFAEVEYKLVAPPSQKMFALPQAKTERMLFMEWRTREGGRGGRRHLHGPPLGPGAIITHQPLPHVQSRHPHTRRVRKHTASSSATSGEFQPFTVGTATGLTSTASSRYSARYDRDDDLPDSPLSTASSSVRTTSEEDDDEDHSQQYVRSSSHVRSRKLQRSDSGDLDIRQSPTGTFSSAYQRSVTHFSSASAGSSSAAAQAYTDPSASEQSERSRRSETSSQIELSLYYSLNSQTLTLTLERARHLPAKSSKQYFFLAYLVPKGGDSMEFSVVDEGCNLSLSQSFVFKDVTIEEVCSQTLMLSIYDGTTLGNPLGSVIMPLESTDLCGMKAVYRIDTSSEEEYVS